MWQSPDEIESMTPCSLWDTIIIRGLRKSRIKLNWLFAFPECVSCSLGLFQAAVVISYTTYLTWSALSHEPDDLCNPPGYVISGYDQNTGLSLQTIVSGVFVFVTLIYASFSTAMSASKLSKFSVLIDYRLIYFVTYSQAQRTRKKELSKTLVRLAAPVLATASTVFWSDNSIKWLTRDGSLAYLTAKSPKTSFN